MEKRNKFNVCEDFPKENQKQCIINDVGSSAYADLAKFINKAHERRFNDSLMRLIIKEIQLKSCDFNETMILPRYFEKDTIYEGVVYKRAAKINELLSKKAVNQAKQLIKKGSKMDFKNLEHLRNWIHLETGINNGSLAALFE
ncbi:MAG: hypothetical protein KDD03_06685 [Gelidibacter sp.]|nr:hypothetical protein [Gelidibacter sp.]